MSSQPLFNLALQVRALELYERYGHMSPEDAALLDYPDEPDPARP